MREGLFFQQLKTRFFKDKFKAFIFCNLKKSFLQLLLGLVRMFNFSFMKKLYI